jgi:hypothetical protein
MDENMMVQEISDFNAEQGMMRGDDMQEVMADLNDEAEADYADMQADSYDNPVDMGVFDDDPSPYDGNYSEE